MNRKFGYACTPITLPYKTTRGFILKNFSEERFNECVEQNLQDLKRILNWNVQNNILMFRISSDIIPFGSHTVNNIDWWNVFKEELLSCGDYIKNNNLRVSMHPGQYTVLNSIDKSIVSNSIKDLEYHCIFLDSMNIDYSNKIVLHVGGVYGNKSLAMDRFVYNFSLLSNSVKKRLVLENDDKSFNIEDVLSICNRINIPAVFDNLHHKANPCNVSIKDILKSVSNTWKSIDGNTKFHYSDQDINKKNGAHSPFLITENFLNYLELIEDIQADIMIEMKDKEVSALKCVNLFDKDLSVKQRETQWAKYKYCIMEKNYSFYKECSNLVTNKAPLSDIYIFIDNCLFQPFSQGNFVNAAEHVYGYVKNNVSVKEKNLFYELLKSPLENKYKIKLLLKRLCLKYNANYINESYYFLY